MSEIPKSWIGKKVRILVDNPNSAMTLFKGDIVEVIEADNPLAQMFGLPAMVRKRNGRSYAVKKEYVELVEEQLETPIEIDNPIEELLRAFGEDNGTDELSSTYSEANPPKIGERVEVTNYLPNPFGMDEGYKNGDTGTIIEPDELAKLFDIEYLVQIDGYPKPRVIAPEELSPLVEEPEFKEGQQVELLEDDHDWQCYKAGYVVSVIEKHGELGFMDDEGDFRTLEGKEFKKL